MASPAYARKKQPEAVRRALLDAAARIAVEQGAPGITVQAVAEAAGVTKGGLFHHFPNKQALIEAMFADVLEQLDREIDAHMAQDQDPHGPFSRAYVETLLVGERFGVGSPFDALSVAVLAEPSLGDLWATWLRDRLVRHQDTDADPMLEVVRLATDGAWLNHVIQRTERPRLEGLREQLLNLTRQAAP
ncbi:TetR/AcrR family transcriptional regulator [Rubellimicrobium arenae]|uniref:TetR/AcrR family transcriptional regulator n=1 Tax=Rubellimicrobium arenae TaxID=2817372 RepID=UPI001B307B47|nr:TetR/AcrR family transcriptional regulator [Rubellimicrobium arenae]